MSTAEPPRNKDFFTVYVSAVEHPGHFWLQIVNSKAQDLDLMLMNMSEFYNNPENQKVNGRKGGFNGNLAFW